MNKKGMALAYVLFFAFAIFLLIIAMSMFQSHKVFKTTYEGGAFQAECAAETGIHCAITEIRQHYGWSTHKKVDKNDNFSSPINPEVNIKDSADLKVKSKNGLYYGSIGDAEFKVKVAKIDYLKDNPNTKDTNEKEIFYKIVSMGMVTLPNGRHVVRKISTIVEEHSLNKYVAFDADELNLCYGVPGGDNNEPNILSIGKIYGGKYLDIGTIRGNVPQLILDNISDISTGSQGRVFFSTDGNVIIKNDTPSINVKIGTQWDKFSTVAQEPDNTIDPLNRLKGILKDSYTGGKDVALVSDPAPQLKKLAETKGVYIKESDGTDSIINYSFSSSGTEIDGVKILNFGKMIISNGVGKGDDTSALGKIPEGFNGIIYSECPLMIYGNPDQDLTIYSEKDIYISGDFNQRVNKEGPYEPVQQNYKSVNKTAYKGSADNNSKYVKENLDFRKNHTTLAQAPYWQNIDIIAKGRVWIDFTNPKLFLRNELLPLIEYDLCEILCRDTTNNINQPQEASKTFSYQNVLKVQKDISSSSSGKRGLDLIANSYSGEVAVNTIIKEYLQDYLNIPNAQSIIDSIDSQIKNNSGFPVSSRNAIVKDIWDKLTNDSFKRYQRSTNILGSAVNNGKYGLPSRLYWFTCKDGEYNQFKNTDYANDRLFWPEMTINAQIKSFAKRNAVWKSRPDLVDKDNYDKQPGDWPATAYIEGGKAINTIKAVAAIRPEMGNHSNSPFRFLPDNTLIQRIYGAEANLRTGDKPSFKANGHYGPCLRKKVFDPNCKTPFELRAYNLVTFEKRGSNYTVWKKFK